MGGDRHASVPPGGETAVVWMGEGEEEGVAAGFWVLIMVDLVVKLHPGRKNIPDHKVECGGAPPVVLIRALFLHPWLFGSEEARGSPDIPVQDDRLGRICPARGMESVSRALPLDSPDGGSLEHVRNLLGKGRDDGPHASHGRMGVEGRVGEAKGRRKKPHLPGGGLIGDQKELVETSKKVPCPGMGGEDSSGRTESVQSPFAKKSGGEANGLGILFGASRGKGGKVSDNVPCGVGDPKGPAPQTLGVVLRECRGKFGQKGLPVSAHPDAPVGEMDLEGRVDGMGREAEAQKTGQPPQREGRLKSDQCGGAGIIGQAVALEGSRTSPQIVHGLEKNDRSAGMGQHRPGQDAPHPSPDNGHIVCRLIFVHYHSHAFTLPGGCPWLFQPWIRSG